MNGEGGEQLWTGTFTCNPGDFLMFLIFDVFDVFEVTILIKTRGG